MSDALVIIPTYNEKENIEAIIRATFNQKKAFHILIVDDNSPDGTSEIVTNLMKEFPNQLFLEKRLGKNGLGTAYIHGFKWAIAKKYDYIIEMDAASNRGIEEIRDLKEAVAQAGAVAARTGVAGAGQTPGTAKLPASKSLLKRLGS